MAISISGSNAISGLSGNDTNFDKVLEQLKKIESSQLNRLEAWKGDWNLRYEAFGKIIEQVQAASSMLSALSDKNNFVTKNVSSSNENIITAVANASAQDVQHTIKVSQMASNAIWANTGCVFDSKTDIINDTGDVQYFRFNYAGKDHSIKVPAGTTLESFASMVNNSTENPGIKVSLIQTGSGYVYQVAGKDTGADNNLIIYNNNLKGMGASGTNSSWLTNGSLDANQSLTNPTEYTYDLVLRNGAKKSVTVKGNSTADQLVTALNAAAGGINARLDADGNLLMDGVKSFSRRKSSDEAYTPPSTWVGVGSGSLNDDKLNAAGGMAEGKGDNDLLTFTMTMEDGSTREFKIKAGASKRDLLVQMAQATQSGDSVNIGMNNAGSWGVNLSGVTNVACADLTDAGKLQSSLTPAKGVRDELGGTLDSASATLTFAAGKLGKRIDGKDDETPPPPGSELVFTITKKDGSVVYVDKLAGTPLTSNMTNQQLLEAVNAACPGALTTDADGNQVLKLDGVKDFKLTTGSSGTAGFTTSFEASTKVPKTNPDTTGNSLFYTDGTNTYLEEPPDLVYTFTTNNGETGTLTLTSPQTMKDVLAELKAGTGIVWKDKDGNSMASAPADWGVAYTDADGKEYMAAGGTPLDLDDIDGPVYLQLKNVQNVEGPALQGQVATSDNWTIQRSANARYTVDNWPMEMESASNSVSDVIEGVVFSIQNTGDAHISISTDITSVEQSIQNFLDAVNSVLLTVRDYTSYDEDKEVTSNDPDDIEKKNYSASGLTNQKGGLLQGNYGVQLFKSRFSSVLSTSPPGFKSRQSADDILSGDVLASLANLGIKTDTDESSETYGLLVIAPKSGIAELQTLDKESYNDMITNNLEAVVDFFCASGTGSSTSADFRYGSHVEGITKAGNYEVKYHVETGSDGKPQITNVTVGGVEATRDESMPGNYFSVAKGDARGLSIQIDDLSLGDHPPAGEEPMYVRIKQGLAQTVNSFFKDELNFTTVNITSNMTQSEIDDAIALKSKNGALMSLRDNYKTIMENIDKKIEREQYRLETWETRQKTIFANLETLLKNYSEQQKTLESQLKQLSGND